MADDGTASISKFNPSTMRTDTVCAVVGKRGVGKTVLLLDLMYHLRQRLDFGCTMTPTMSSMIEFERRCPPIASYSNFNAAAIDRIMTTQKSQLKKQRKKPKDQRRPLKNIYIIADDCMYDKKILAGKTIREVFMNGRHNNIMFIFLVQYIMDIPCDLRTQVDYVFAGRETNSANREKLYKNLFGAVPTVGDFNTLMDNFTNNREWLVLDNTGKTNNLEDCVHWYKADLHEDKEYCVGQRRFWMLNHAYNKDEDEDDDDDVVIGNNAATGTKTGKTGDGSGGAGAGAAPSASKNRKSGATSSQPSKRSRLLNVCKADEDGNDLEGPMAALAAKQHQNAAEDGKEEEREREAASRTTDATRGPSAAPAYPSAHGASRDPSRDPSHDPSRGTSLPFQNISRSAWDGRDSFRGSRPPSQPSQTLQTFPSFQAFSSHRSPFDDDDDNNDDDDDDDNFFG